MNVEKLIKAGRWTALLSFLIGTIIFVTYFFTSADQLLYVGYIFLALAVIVNIIVLIFIAKAVFNSKAKRRKLLFTGFLLLLNIPITLFYCRLTEVLLCTMRIKLINTRTEKLTDIKIDGCQSKQIDELKQGESKTIWIVIEGDCSIKMNYLRGGNRMEETIEAYVTPGMGQIKEYTIEANKNPFLHH